MIAPRISTASLQDSRVRWAGVALAVALVVLAAATVGAVRVTPVEAAAPAPAVPDSALRFTPVGSGIDVAAAVARDLFTDDRSPPARRYRVPGEGEYAAPEPAPRPVVLGTAIAADGEHFATCQAAGGVPVIVHVGSKIADYTVVNIVRGSVTFRAPDGERFTINAIPSRP